MDEWATCDDCGCNIKKVNLSRHKRKVHRYAPKVVLPKHITNAVDRMFAIIESIPGHRIVTVAADGEFQIDVNKNNKYGYDEDDGCKPGTHRALLNLCLTQASIAAGGVVIRQFLDATTIMRKDDPALACPICGEVGKCDDSPGTDIEIPMKVVYMFFLEDGHIIGLSSKEAEDSSMVDDVGHKIPPEFGVIYADSRALLTGPPNTLEFDV